MVVAYEKSEIIPEITEIWWNHWQHRRNLAKSWNQWWNRRNPGEILKSDEILKSREESEIRKSRTPNRPVPYPSGETESYDTVKKKLDAYSVPQRNSSHASQTRWDCQTAAGYSERSNKRQSSISTTKGKHLPRDKKGHYQTVCRSTAQVTTVEEKETQLEEALLGALTDTSRDHWNITLQLNGHPVLFCIDTGADVTAISERV